MNRHEIDIAILQRLLRATMTGRIQWHKGPDQQFSTTLGDEEIVFRLFWYEATNQVGADPRVFELTMPGRRSVFAFGTEGCDLLFEILEAAFDSWKGHCDYTGAYEYLDEAIPE